MIKEIALKSVKLTGILSVSMGFNPLRPLKGELLNLILQRVFIFILNEHHQYEVYDGVVGQLRALVPTGSTPYGAVIDRNGQLWGMSRPPYQIDQIDTRTRQFVRAVPLSTAYGIALDTDGAIWVSMWIEKRILRFDPVSNTQDYFNSPNGEDQLRGITLDLNRNVWVASSTHDVLIKYTFAPDRRTLANRCRGHV